MPVVLVDLGGFAIAIFLLCCAVVVIALSKMIGGALGFFGVSLPIIGKIGLDIGGWVAGAGESLATWIVSASKGTWHDIENWFTGHAYLMYHLFQSTVQVVDHIGGQVAHIVNSSIPNAIDYAVSQAASFTTKQINGVEGDITKAAAATAAALSAADRSIYQTISGVQSTVENDLKAAVSSAVAEAEHFTSVGLADLKAYVDNAVSGAESLAASALLEAKTQIGGAIAATAQLAQAELASTAGVLGQDITNVAAGAAAALSGAERTLGGEIEGVATGAASALSGAVGTLTGEISSTAAGAAAATAAVAGTLGGEISSDVGALTDKIGSAVGTLTGDITSEAQSFTGDLSTLQATLTAAIAASIAGVLTRVEELEKCSVGVCEESPNNFKQLLNDALGLAEFAGLGAFLTSIIDHPAAAEQDYASAIQGTFSAGRTALDDVLAL